MPIFYCYTEVSPCFTVDAEEVRAATMRAAAEEYGCYLFGGGGCELERPIDVIVAETREGKNATRFKVSRRIIVEDTVREIGEVEIPPMEDE